VMIRLESLDVKGQCAYFCICLIINIKYITVRRPTMIKEYGGLNLSEGLHVVGDILTKISINCVINYMLHYYLRVYFYGFILCVVYNCVYIYGYFCI
jgi:mannose/fructose/N-acetylgalactosamine-specific phosphotransferase system component IIC